MDCCGKYGKFDIQKMICIQRVSRLYCARWIIKVCWMYLVHMRIMLFLHCMYIDGSFQMIKFGSCFCWYLLFDLLCIYNANGVCVYKYMHAFVYICVTKLCLDSCRQLQVHRNINSSWWLGVYSKMITNYCIVILKSKSNYVCILE